MSTAKKSYKVLTSYYRPKPGGLCKRLFRSMEALLDDGHEVHYLAVVKFPIDHNNCYYHKFPWPENKTESTFFWVFFHLYAPFILLYIGIKFKITHLFAFSTNYAFLMQPLRMLRSIPLSLFLRGDAIENHRIKGRSRCLLGLEKLIESFAINGVNLYGVSEALVNAVMQRHRVSKPLKSGVIRNDIDERITHPDRVCNKPLKLVCVGVLENRKNQSLLLECMQSISVRDAVLYFYGVGPKENELKIMAQKLEVNDKVCFEGWVASQTIWPNADVLLQPSMHEGAPNAVLEALANNIPVLASDIPEHKEILPAYNLLSIDSYRSWVKELKGIIFDADGELHKLRVSQIPYAEKLNFDWESEVCKHILVEG